LDEGSLSGYFLVNRTRAARIQLVRNPRVSGYRGRLLIFPQLDLILGQRTLSPEGLARARALARRAPAPSVAAAGAPLRLPVARPGPRARPESAAPAARGPTVGTRTQSVTEPGGPGGPGRATAAAWPLTRRTEWPGGPRFSADSGSESPGPAEDRDCHWPGRHRGP
jgi:hypothetical protein